jgi:hypothetical protein
MLQDKNLYKSLNNRYLFISQNLNDRKENSQSNIRGHKLKKYKHIKKNKF